MQNGAATAATTMTPAHASKTNVLAHNNNTTKNNVENKPIINFHNHSSRLRPLTSN